MAEPKFHPGLPKQCPIPGAQQVNQPIYRALRGNNPVPYDFTSLAERKSYASGTGDCDAWGLSSWIDARSAQRAKQVIPFIRKLKIAKVDIALGDGVLMHTPSAKQPKHYTFWKDISVNLCHKSSVVIP